MFVSPLQESRCRLSLVHSNQVPAAQRKQSGPKAQQETGPRLDPRHCSGNGSLSPRLSPPQGGGGKGLAWGLGTQQVLKQ